MDKLIIEKLYKIFTELYIDGHIDSLKRVVNEMNEGKKQHDEVFRVKLSLEKVKYESKKGFKVINSETFAYFDPDFYPNSVFANMTPHSIDTKFIR